MKDRTVKAVDQGQKLIIFIYLLFLSCINPPINNTEVFAENPANTGPLCSTQSACESRCQVLFKESDSFKTCLNLKTGGVEDLENTLNKIKEGSWDSLKTSQISTLMQVDKEARVWLRYIGGHKTKSRDMLLWLAENKDISPLLKDNTKILKSAFKNIARAGGREPPAVEGMTTDIDDSEQGVQAFFEICAEEKNEEGFRLGHELLVEECEDKGKFCVKTVYCRIKSPLVFSLLNALDLGEEADTDDGQLHISDCP